MMTFGSMLRDNFIIVGNSLRSMLRLSRFWRRVSLGSCGRGVRLELDIRCGEGGASGLRYLREFLTYHSNS